jgi:hypothetical protein
MILHFTDHDPSGLNMTNDLVNRIGDYLVNAVQTREDGEHVSQQFSQQFAGERRAITILRCALLYEQVQQSHLASNPTKTADPRAAEYVARFGNECWELDALPPDELQTIIRNSINAHIDIDRWNERRNEIETETNQIRERLAHLRITFE